MQNNPLKYMHVDGFKQQQGWDNRKFANQCVKWRKFGYYDRIVREKTKFEKYIDIEEFYRYVRETANND